ncbi:hypothetical protein NP493_91g04042, partial [Ridgeia piscesae]
GGILDIEVVDTLKVDGYIWANSRDLVGDRSGGSGGSGGSILIRTGNFTGSHTGAIRALGGTGQIENVDGKGASGSGSGGRIAIYHSTSRLISPYRGTYDTEGGTVGSVAEAGAAGTVFLHHVGLDHTTLRIDNKDRFPKVEDTAITNSGRRLDLSAASVATMSRDGFNVSASAKYTYLDLPSNFYLVQYLFDQSLEKSATQSYMSAATVASIEVQLNQTLFINNVRVFPISNGSSTSFKVTGYDTAGEFEITSEYVKLPSQTVQGSFIELPVMRDAIKIEFSLQSPTYATLSQLEIFVGGENVFDRYLKDLVLTINFKPIEGD